MGSCRSLTAAYSSKQQQYPRIIFNHKAATDLSISHPQSDIPCSESLEIHDPQSNPRSPPSLFQNLTPHLPSHISIPIPIPFLVLVFQT